MRDFDGLYQQDTLFDQLWLALRRPMQRIQRRHAGLLWPLAFGGLALAFLICGASFLFYAIVPAQLTLAAQLAQLGSALLAFGVAHHFVRNALSTAGLPGRVATLLQARCGVVATDLVLGSAAFVVLPLTLFLAFASHAALGILLTLAYGMAAQQLWRQACQEGRWFCALFAAAQTVPASRTIKTAQPLAIPAAVMAPSRTDYLRELREAGVNIRIAKILVAAGLTSVAAVRSASDADILKVHGVGAATLRRLRQCCGGGAG